MRPRILRVMFAWTATLALASCVGSTQVLPTVKARTQSVAEFLAAVRTRGAELGCNARLVEDALGARVQQPKIAQDNGIYRAVYELAPVEDSLIQGNGEYTQFRSSATSFCQIKIDIAKGALCEIYSEQYRAVVGAGPVPYRPPHPPRNRTPDQLAFHLFGQAAPEQRDEVWLSSRHGERCAYQVIVRTRGKFPESQ